MNHVTRCPKHTLTAALTAPRPMTSQVGGRTPRYGNRLLAMYSVSELARRFGAEPSTRSSQPQAPSLLLTPLLPTKPRNSPPSRAASTSTSSTPEAPTSPRASRRRPPTGEASSPAAAVVAAVAAARRPRRGSRRRARTRWCRTSCRAASPTSSRRSPRSGGAPMAARRWTARSSGCRCARTRRRRRRRSRGASGARRGCATCSARCRWLPAPPTLSLSLSHPSPHLPSSLSPLLFTSPPRLSSHLLS